jgi:hypothetical protein
MPDENKKQRTYEEVQGEINFLTNKKKEYQKKVSEAIDKVESDPDKVAKLKTYVNNLTLGATEKERKFCIGSACYTLNQAGELLKYTSNASVEKDITSGKLKGYHYDYNLNDVEPGDILQLNKKTEKGLRGAPYHGMLVKKVEKDKSGNVTAVEYYGSQGLAESFGTHRIEGVSLDNYRADKTSHEVIKKDFIPNSLYAERDAVKPIVKPIVKKYVDYEPNQTIGYLGSNDESEDKKKNRAEYIDKMMGRKEELMRAYNLSNNEYNDLVKLSAGIIDQESEYGTSARYKAKNIPGVQFVGKILKGDIKEAFSLDEYSTGAGQGKEKYFPSKAGKKFGITPDSKEATLLTVLDRYSNQVSSELKGTSAAYLKTANVYKGMSSDNNEYAKSVLDKASSFGLTNYDHSKASLINIKNKAIEKKQNLMQQSFAPVVKQENFVNIKKEPVVKFEYGGLLNSLDNNKFQDGGEFGDYKQAGPVEDRPSEYVGKAGMTGMMRAKIATEANYGNPSALRIVSPNPNKYTFTGEEKDWRGNQASPAGTYGTHFMSSFGNQARPGLQEVNGKMQYFQDPPRNSKENINFSRPEDANYFAENYKDVAPMMRGTAPDVTNATEYVKGWYNSPMYDKILRNQIADAGIKSPRRTERIVKRYNNNFNKDLNNSFYDVTPDIVDSPEYYGRSINDYKGGKKINLNKNFVESNPKLVNSLFSHELAHDNLMTDMDEKYINKNTPQYNPTIHNEKTYNKLTHPGEVRSQIHSIRQLSGENKIYDPLTQPFKKEYLDKVNESYKQGTGDKKYENYNQLQRLRQFYSDDQITEMMNTITKSNSNDGKVYAKNGGWLDGLTTNKFDMGGLLDGLDKGTQVPDATATAKPVVDLNFAVTPAQKQVAAKNKRQAEVDMQVDHPEFYRNQNFLDKKAVKPYNVEDYKKGIKEPGLQTSADPIDLVGTGVYKNIFKNSVRAIYPTMEKTLLKTQNLAGKAITSKPVNQIVDKFNKAGKAEQKVQQGSDYIDNWYENPLINERYNNFRNKGAIDSYKSTKAGDIINLIKGSNKPRYSEVLSNPKSNIKLSLDYEKLDRKPLSNMGIAYDYGDTYVNKLAKNKASVAAHERTHQYFPGFTYNEAEIKALREPFKLGNTKYERYLKKPQELHARINEARFQLGLKPEDKVTSEMLKKLKTNTPGMKKMFNSVKDEKALINLFNNFYTPAAIVGVGAKALEQDKKQNGGWLDNLK